MIKLKFSSYQLQYWSGIVRKPLFRPYFTTFCLLHCVQVYLHLLQLVQLQAKNKIKYQQLVLERESSINTVIDYDDATKVTSIVDFTTAFHFKFEHIFQDISHPKIHQISSKINKVRLSIQRVRKDHSLDELCSTKTREIDTQKQNLENKGNL